MEADNSDYQSPEIAPPIGRLYVGGGIFVAGFLAPLLIPLVTISALSTAWKATLSGLLLVGIPEIGMVIAVAVLGKPGFQYLKQRLFHVIKRIAPPDRVGRVRYSCGLVLFAIPLFYGFIGPYVANLLPDDAPSKLLLAATGDVMLLTSLFLLGGEFWDKLRSLFIRESRVDFSSWRCGREDSRRH